MLWIKIERERERVFQVGKTPEQESHGKKGIWLMTKRHVF